MQATRLDAAGETTFVLIFETGDEVIAELTNFATQQGLNAAHFTAIGAFREATLLYFDWESKQYQEIPIREQVEVLSLVGDIADKDGAPKVHAHVVVGKRDGTAWGGHIKEAFVRPTLEVTLTESPRHLRRKHDAETGLALIDLGAGTSP